MKHVIAAIFLCTVAPVATARPVLVFSGGFGSCMVNGDTSELKASEKMDALAQKVAQAVGSAPVEIRTCYAVGNDPLYVSVPELGLDSESMSIEDLGDVVREASRVAGANAPVYAWGHSHGGWTVMNLLAVEASVNYRGLMTVDPISVVECGPAVFMGGVITGDAPGCQTSPEDLEPVGAEIARRAHNWKNYYQTDFELLHSDMISAAHNNRELQIDASWWSLMGAHAQIEHEESVWHDFAQTILTDIKK